jgi:hypothetical protein
MPVGGAERPEVGGQQRLRLRLAFQIGAPLPRGERPKQHAVRRLARDNIFLPIERHQYPFEAVRQGLRQVVPFRFDKTVADAHRLAQPLPEASMPHIQTLQANETEC